MAVSSSGVDTVAAVLLLSVALLGTLTPSAGGGVAACTDTCGEGEDADEEVAGRRTPALAPNAPPWPLFGVEVGRAFPGKRAALVARRRLGSKVGVRR